MTVKASRENAMSSRTLCVLRLWRHRHSLLSAPLY
jgi:hypothetical protein